MHRLLLRVRRLTTKLREMWGAWQGEADGETKDSDV
jgi:hypothetical protein